MKILEVRIHQYLHYIARLHKFLSTLAVLCVFLARQHYSLDIILSYYVTTQLFWTYHSLCLQKTVFRELKNRYGYWCITNVYKESMITNQPVQTNTNERRARQQIVTIRDELNFISNCWWWPLFVYFEIIHEPPDTNDTVHNSV